MCVVLFPGNDSILFFSIYVPDKQYSQGWGKPHHVKKKVLLGGACEIDCELEMCRQANQASNRGCMTYQECPHIAALARCKVTIKEAQLNGGLLHDMCCKHNIFKKETKK